MATLTKPCPKCGNPMSSESRSCSACYRAKPSSRTDTCPGCGGVKSKRAVLCSSCSRGSSRQTYIPKGHPRLGEPTFDPGALDTHWAAAFAGFFLGEGSVQLSRRSHGLPTPVLQIKLRQDNRPILEDIQRHLGGWLTDMGDYGRSRPSTTWNLTGFVAVKPVLELLLSSPIPGKKLDDVRIALDYILWRMSLGNFPTPEQKLEAERYFQAIRDIRVFKVQG